MSIPFEFPCDRSAGFIMSPDVRKTVGYITALNVSVLRNALASDLQVPIPFDTGTGPTYGGLEHTAPERFVPGVARVVGVLERFSWAGGVGDPLELDIWMSQENASEIWELKYRSPGLNNASVTALAWWIGAYDQETKVWYEASHPLPASGTPITGIINGHDADMNPTQVADGIDVNVYKVSLKVAPAAGKRQHTFHMASSSQKQMVKSWGGMG